MKNCLGRPRFLCIAPEKSTFTHPPHTCLHLQLIEVMVWLSLRYRTEGAWDLGKSVWAPKFCSQRLFLSIHSQWLERGRERRLTFSYVECSHSRRESIHLVAHTSRTWERICVKDLSSKWGIYRLSLSFMHRFNLKRVRRKMAKENSWSNCVALPGYEMDDKQNIAKSIRIITREKFEWFGEDELI